LLLKSAWPNPLGLSLQLQGLGVESWLEGEGGVVHFYDPAATGPKRRQRFRILAFPQRLAAVHLPLDWLEPVAANLPDPRRVIDLAAQRITSSSDVENIFSQGKVHEGLFINMQLEHERALWQSIGYVAIPRSATLDGINDMDIPY
ncbi:MAG: hypothetical protein KDA51_06425, partial [Planctomycetales bacterium]|nr:hypothetical protein [Planctomycetales bacterium]